jgi:hypothetical protein
MITIQADFNHLDGAGRLLLSDLAIHDGTPFEMIAASGKPVLFVQGEDIVFGRLVNDPSRGWCAEVDLDTQDIIEVYPRPVLVRAS